MIFIKMPMDKECYDIDDKPIKPGFYFDTVNRRFVRFVEENPSVSLSSKNNWLVDYDVADEKDSPNMLYNSEQAGKCSRIDEKDISETLKKGKDNLNWLERQVAELNSPLPAARD
jgi:hypothetical protein